MDPLINGMKLRLLLLTLAEWGRLIFFLEKVNMYFYENTNEHVVLASRGGGVHGARVSPRDTQAAHLDPTGDHSAAAPRKPSP